MQKYLRTSQTVGIVQVFIVSIDERSNVDLQINALIESLDVLQSITLNKKCMKRLHSSPCSFRQHRLHVSMANDQPSIRGVTKHNRLLVNADFLGRIWYWISRSCSPVQFCLGILRLPRRAVACRCDTGTVNSWNDPVKVYPNSVLTQVPATQVCETVIDI